MFKKVPFKKRVICSPVYGYKRVRSVTEYGVKVSGFVRSELSDLLGPDFNPSDFDLDVQLQAGVPLREVNSKLLNVRPDSSDASRLEALLSSAVDNESLNSSTDSE